MQERYLFRAKRIDTGEWVEGYLSYPFCTENGNESYYFYAKDSLNFFCRCVVNATTICQCTGLKDKNANLIWENDIVRTVYDGNEHIYQVVWDESELDFKATNGKENYESNFEYLPCCDEIEILGNCFDNPELLEV